MSRFSKILLAVAILNLMAALLFMTDLVDVSGIPSLYGVFPLGTVVLGLFLLSLGLRREVAVYDAEHRADRDSDASAEPSGRVPLIHGRKRHWYSHA
jgi:hypothetical protein